MQYNNEGTKWFCGDISKTKKNIETCVHEKNFDLLTSCRLSESFVFRKRLFMELCNLK